MLSGSGAVTALYHKGFLFGGYSDGSIKVWNVDEKLTSTLLWNIKEHKSLKSKWEWDHRRAALPFISRAGRDKEVPRDWSLPILWQATEAYGKPKRADTGLTNAGHYNKWPKDTQFFKKEAGGWKFGIQSMESSF